MKKNQKKMLDVVFILDKSGSMSGSEKDTIHSFNEYIEKEKGNSFPTKISTILFSDHFHYLQNRVEVSKVKKMTSKEYFVGGCTALYDAIGHAITTIDQEDTDKVMFVIITDGYENASKEFNHQKIREMIQKHSQYEFIYIGADIDSYAAGGDIGIDRSHIANFKKDEKGTSLLFQSLRKAEKCMFEGNSSFDTHWKEDLETYLEENESK